MGLESQDSGWVARFRRVPNPKARMFCFPYAGGSSAIFARWHLDLPTSLDVCAIELPGRGLQRGATKTDPRVDTVVEGLCAALKESLDLPFFLYGHSLGTLLAFEFARALRRKRLPAPFHLFLSGGLPVHYPMHVENKSVPDMSDAQLFKFIRRRVGKVPEILSEPALVRRTLPLIRHDFAMLRSYAYAIEKPLPCPLTALCGVNDTLSPAQKMADWRIHTSGRFELEMFEGSHFFLTTSRQALLKSMSRTIESDLAQAASPASSADDLTYRYGLVGR
jgi:medium-chain acyl-[acyl-carrier-protein] hydrolase